MTWRLKAFVCATLGVVIAAHAAVWPSAAFSRPPSLHASLGRPLDLGHVVLDVTVGSVGPGPINVARSDFTLSASGDMFAAQGWDAGRPRVEVSPRHSRRFRLTFGVTSAAASHAVLVYRPGARGSPRFVPLRTARAATASPTIKTFPITGGVGNPWGTAIDAAGAIWFAEPGCDFAPTCAADAPPGQLGRFDPSSGAFSHYTLPDIPGNQPIFVAFDQVGNLWFTTPDNSMIGEFSPSTGTFVGQWPVTPGSGPWDLTFANGQIWFTEHYGAAVGRFDPATHAYQDFPTPSASSNPYGIAASGGLIWFTENNSSVDRVAVLDTGANDAISEYAIVQPSDGTPHLIAVGPDGHPWWTEGWSDTIATLDPAVAVPGGCGSDSGVCTGVQRFLLPASSSCGEGAHSSGIAVDGAANRVWLDDSLTDQVGWFTPSAGTFDMRPVGTCNAHPHDGLSLDAVGNAWVSEQFADAIAVVLAGSPGSPIGPPAGTMAAGPAPANVVKPTIHGRLREGQKLIARTGSWVNDPANFSYTWQRCRPACADVAVGTSGSYRLSARDIDGSVRVVVTARNAGGSAQAKSRAAGPVGPSPRRVKAALATLLATGTKRSTITRLLRTGSWQASFGAPSSGRLSIAFRARRSTLVGGARWHFANTGRRVVTVRLTRTGRRLVKRAAKLRLRVQVVYVPAGGPAIRRSKRLSAIWSFVEAGRRAAAAASPPPAPQGRARPPLAAAARPARVSPTRSP
jgi:streptogramin lyase